VPGATLHVGDSGALSFGVANLAAADGYSETLVATVASLSGGLFAGLSGGVGTTARLAPGASTAVGVSVNTAKAAVIKGVAAVTVASDGGVGVASLDGLSQTSLGTQNLGVTFTVDNFAHPDFQVESGTAATVTGTGLTETLNFGTIARGTGC